MYGLCDLFQVHFGDVTNKDLDSHGQVVDRLGKKMPKIKKFTPGLSGEYMDKQMKDGKFVLT